MSSSVLRLSSVATVLSCVLLSACAASSRQRPVGMGDVNTGTESLAATRKQLEGTWTLTKFEVADNTGNLSIRGVLQEPLPGQKTVTDAPALAYTGKAAIDTVRKEMVLTGTNATVEPDPSLLAKIGPELRRRYEFGADGTLTISILNASGGITSKATFRK